MEGPPPWRFHPPNAEGWELCEELPTFSRSRSAATFVKPALPADCWATVPVPGTKRSVRAGLPLYAPAARSPRPGVTVAELTLLVWRRCRWGFEAGRVLQEVLAWPDDRLEAELAMLRLGEPDG